MNVLENRVLDGNVWNWGGGGRQWQDGAEICITRLITIVFTIYYQNYQIKLENLWGK